MIDTSIVPVHQHGACIAKNQRQSIGRLRQTSKIRALVDGNGLPVRLPLTPAVVFGGRHDAVSAPAGAEDNDADHEGGRGSMHWRRQGFETSIRLLFLGGDHPRPTGTSRVVVRAAWLSAGTSLPSQCGG